MITDYLQLHILLHPFKVRQLACHFSQHLNVDTSGYTTFQGKEVPDQNKKIHYKD